MMQGRETAMATNSRKIKSSLSIPIYLDYSSTTPVDKRVASKMAECLTLDGAFGNPASRSHSFGWDSDQLIKDARQNVANLIKCDSKEVIWTSGATESNNLAIKGAAHFYKSKGNHLITLTTEHKAVLDTMRQLESEGYSVTYLDPEPNGLLDIKKLEAAITDKTLLISVMHVNNEIGVVQDLEKIGSLTRKRRYFFMWMQLKVLEKLTLMSINSMSIYSLFLPIRYTAQKVLEHYMSEESQEYDWNHKCMEEVTNEDLDQELCPHIKS